MARYKSEEATKKNYKYIRDYNKKNYTRHEARLRTEDEEKLQKILQVKNISFNQFTIDNININYNKIKESTEK